MFLDLENQLLFYGSYHHDTVNVGIHVVCVPMLLFTAFTMAANYSPLSISSLDNTPFPPNLGALFAVLYSFLYILMEPVAGAMITPFLLGSAVASTHLLRTYGSTTVNQFALAIHILSWIAQFIGHGFYEHRAPALKDNVVQAVFLAPFFVWFEILFWFGYRPELQARLNQAVEVELDRLKNQKKQDKQVKEKQHILDGFDGAKGVPMTVPRITPTVEGSSPRITITRH